MGNITLFIEGSVVPIIHYPINWAQKVAQSFIFTTRMHVSGRQKEQRGTTSQEGDMRHQMSLSYLADGLRESRRVYNLLFGLKGKPCIVPWLPEPLETDIDVSGLDYLDLKNMEAAHVKVPTSQIIRIDKEDHTVIENRKVLSIDPITNRITVDSDWTAQIDPWRQTFFFCRGMVLADMTTTFANDQVSGIDVRWRSHDDGLLP